MPKVVLVLIKITLDRYKLVGLCDIVVKLHS